MYVYVYIYIYIYIYTHVLALWISFSFCLKHNLNFKGWNSHVRREFPGKFESRNASRRNVSRRIGRKH